MKKKFKAQFGLMLLPIFFFQSSCYSDLEYDIVSIEQNYITVNLMQRTMPDTLIMIADEIKQKADSLQGLSICFLIPSEYKRYNSEGDPHPWALIEYRQEEWDDHMKTYLRIFGSYSDKHKENMIAIKPEGNDVIGKWYLNDPLKECVAIMENWNGNIILKRYYIPDYIEIDGIPHENEWSEMEGVYLLNTHNEFEPYIDYLEMTDIPNEYVVIGNSNLQPTYRITKDGELQYGKFQDKGWIDIYDPIK